MATEFGTGKTVFILAIVVGCFAILWPKIFYPMLQESVAPKTNIINSQDCCDVIFDKDINAIKIMTELCEKILYHQEDYKSRLTFAFQQGRLTKEIVNRCKNEVLNKCDIDITAFLAEKIRLGKNYKQMLDDVRSLNSSLCLKENFGVTPSELGAPRRMRIWSYTLSKHIRQERPPHLRPEMLHPALREKGRAIPQSHIVPKVIEKEGRPPPIPGMRPPMGGAGHVVPAPKGGNTMGIIMPMYTVGIVIFFMYTMMKLLFKKSEESSAYKEFTSDPEFRRVVFNETDYCTTKNSRKVEEENATKLVVTAITGLVAEVKRDILSKQETEESLVQAELPEPEKKGGPESVAVAEQVDTVNDEKDNKGAVVQVVGMEMTESCEGGQRWSRPPTPVPTPVQAPTGPIIPIEPAQEIFLEGSLPLQSHLLVSQSEVQKLPLDEENNDASVILAGKVTLSLIGVDSEIRDHNGEPAVEECEPTLLNSFNGHKEIREEAGASLNLINSEKENHNEERHFDEGSIIKFEEESLCNKEAEKEISFIKTEEEEEEELDEETAAVEKEIIDEKANNLSSDLTEEETVKEKMNHFETEEEEVDIDEEIIEKTSNVECVPSSSVLAASSEYGQETPQADLLSSFNHNGTKYSYDDDDDEKPSEFTSDDGLDETEHETKYITAPLDAKETNADYSEIETTANYKANEIEEADDASIEAEEEEEMSEDEEEEEDGEIDKSSDKVEESNEIDLEEEQGKDVKLETVDSSLDIVDKSKVNGEAVEKQDEDVAYEVEEEDNEEEAEEEEEDEEEEEEEEDDDDDDDEEEEDDDDEQQLQQPPQHSVHQNSSRQHQR